MTYRATRHHSYRSISPQDPWCYHCGAVERSALHEPRFDWTIARDALVGFAAVLLVLIAASGVAQ